MNNNRRLLLKFLLASPLLKLPSIAAAATDEVFDPDLKYILELEKMLIKSPEEALNIFDMEAVARDKLPPAHYGYLATGVNDEQVQFANRKGYNDISLTSRRLRDVSKVDTSVTIFGRKWSSPIAIAPTSSQKAFHPEGEVAMARAAKNKNQLMMLSGVASSSIEEVTQERGEPVWSQLYAGTHWPSTLKMIKRAENTGSPVLVLTVDLICSGNRETLQRFIKRDTRDCAACHGEVRSPFRGRPMFDGINLDDYFAGEQAIDWTLVDKIKEATNMKLVIKGITHSDDALNCLKHGVDGIVVSNHGGRGQVSARATIDVLPEVAKVVNKRIPVLVDGGIRRGADVYKALALGADAVDIGRPTLWGLSAFGSDGVEKVLDILNAELVSVMQQMAVTSIDEISANSLTMK